jgi:predicted house-cleaning noncanonical NTP pyrophosphatase (MazG superfamily)
MRDEEVRVVRDFEPDLMDGEGYKGIFRKSDRNERFLMLKKRLLHDAEVFLEKDDPDVMLDLIEVAYALSALMGYQEEEMVRMRKAVKKDRGGYSRGFIYEPEV